MGRKIFEIKWDNKQRISVPLSELPSRMYTIHVKVEGYKRNFRIIKKTGQMNRFLRQLNEDLSSSKEILVSGIYQHGCDFQSKCWILRTTLLLVIMVPTFVSAQLPKSVKKPNVIIIFTDDQGSADTGLYGSTDLYTPHMDSLAASGVRFSNFYASSSICSPSRAALMTGKSPLAAGVPALVKPKDTLSDMPSKEVTLAELYKENGYATALIGKWHLGQTSQTDPNAQGFDYFFGHHGGCIDNYSHYFYWNGPNRHDLKENRQEVHHPGEYFGDLMVLGAATFVKNNKEKPFFLYWASNLPHYPMQPEQKWMDFYKELSEPRRTYAAQLSTLDERVGQLIKLLEDEKVRNNTIVVFMSDHGHSREERGFFGGGSSGGLRGSKFTLFEGGIKVPAFISWPEKIKSGEIREQIAIGHDWFPTLAELSGILIPDSLKMEGKSLVDVIKENEKSPHHSLTWFVDWPGLPPQWAVRKNEWKLVVNGLGEGYWDPLEGSETIFLSNLDENPAEDSNLAIDNPEIVNELTLIYQNWREKINTQDK